MGSLAAPTVLIEYSDFQCPYCQLIYPTLKQITSQSKGRIAWVLRDFPLYQIHPQALPAVNAAECIADQLGNSAWWRFADIIFADPKKMAPAYYATLALQFGANITEYNSCISSDKFSQKISNEAADAEANGGRGTPYTVVVNTKTGKQYPISGALSFAEIMAVINKSQSSQ